MSFSVRYRLMGNFITSGKRPRFRTDQVAVSARLTRKEGCEVQTGSLWVGVITGGMLGDRLGRALGTQAGHFVLNGFSTANRQRNESAH